MENPNMRKRKNKGKMFQHFPIWFGEGEKLGMQKILKQDECRKMVTRDKVVM